MKVLTLNIWGGKLDDALKHFLAKAAETVDVFCFQEVFNGEIAVKDKEWGVLNIHAVIDSLLQEHTAFHIQACEIENSHGKIPYGLAMFVKKELPIEASGSHEIFQIGEDLGLPKNVRIWNRLLQYVALPYKQSSVTIFNLHGLYTGGNKDDTDARLMQSRRVKQFMATHAGEKILCGDFNLSPETKSLELLETGMKNLVKESGITSTRSHHYPWENRFADYLLVSPGIEVVRFDVLQDVVSDHLPLLLEFN